jgi:hypothetical protein
MAIVHKSIYSVNLPLDYTMKEKKQKTVYKSIYSVNLPLDYTPKEYKKQIVQKDIPEHLKPYIHICNDVCDDTCPETCGLPSRLFKSKCPFIVEKKGDMCRFHQSCKTCPVCLEIITSKKNEFITTCGHSYHKKCRDEYEVKTYRIKQSQKKCHVSWKCHVCDVELEKLIITRKVKSMNIFKDELVIENENQTEDIENQTFLEKQLYSVHGYLYNFLQLVFLNV